MSRARELAKVGGLQQTISGVSTHVGISTFASDVYILGKLDITGDLGFDEMTAVNSKITGVSTAVDTIISRNLSVAGLSTFSGLLKVDGAAIEANSAKISDLTNNRIIIAGTGGELEDDANLTFDSAVLTVTGSTSTTVRSTTLDLDVTRNVEVAGITTFTGAIDANGALDVDGQTDLDVLNVSDVSTFTGAITANGGVVGDVTGALTGAATQITLADESSDTTCFPVFATAATGDLAPKTGDNLTFNSSSGALTATSFVGALTGNVTGNTSGSSGSCTGNAATATILASARTIAGVSFNGSANISLNNNAITNGAGYITSSGTSAACSGNAATATLATNVTATANNGTNETVYPTFVDSSSGGSQGIETDSGLSYNPSTNALSTTEFIGGLTGNVTGNTSGSSGSCTGNAATATILANARTIAGVSFNGSANISLNNNAITNGAGYVTSSGWTSSNDGSGSGLDADLLDGVQGSSYLRSDASDTFTGTLTVSGNILPNANGTRDLGASGTRWANVYSSDLDLSNEAKGGNQVDGSWGSYLIEEGENDLFLKNRRTGKQYKFVLQEV